MKPHPLILTVAIEESELWKDYCEEFVLYLNNHEVVREEVWSSGLDIEEAEEWAAKQLHIAIKAGQ